MKIRLFQRQVPIGSKVKITYSNGENVQGRLIEIGEVHVTLENDNGLITVLSDLIGGWEVQPEHEKIETFQDEECFSQDSKQTTEKKPFDEASPNRAAEHPDKDEGVLDINNSQYLEDKTVVNENIYRKQTEVSKPFDPSINYLNKKIPYTLSLKIPDFSFPEGLLVLDYHLKEKIKKEFDKINSQYQYYLKIRNLAQLPQLAKKLEQLGKKYPQSGVFYYNAGCFMDTFGQYSIALECFEKAVISERLPQYIYNIACSAMKVKDYTKGHIALALYFNTILPSSDIDAWYVFCNITNHIQGYFALTKIVDNVFKKNGNNKFKLNTEFNDSMILICKSFIDFLQENNKADEAAPIISLLDAKSHDVNAAYSLIESSLESLPKTSYPEYEDAIKQFQEKEIVISKLPSDQFKKKPINISNPNGYIVQYEHVHGFIINTSGTKYFFHRSSIIDDVLLSRLNSLTKYEKIPVTFEAKQGDRGPYAIQISHFMTNEKRFEIALKFSASGEFNKAIAHIKRVLAVDPDNPKAKQLYEDWRESARISGVPHGLNPYARARRVQLIEKDLEKAIPIFLDAVFQGDNTDSAVKDLAQIYDQMGRYKEAINLLISKRKIVKDKQSLDNLLIDILIKEEEYDQARELLNKKLENPITKENRVIVFRKIAQSYLHQEKYNEAQEIFEEIIRLRPDDLVAKRNIAVCLSKKGDYDAAEKVLNNILDNSLDAKAAELREAIIQVKKTGIKDQFNEIISGTILSDFSCEISEFTHFFLNNCDFLFVDRKNYEEDANHKKKYVGSDKDAKFDIRKLENQVKNFGTDKARERSICYLSAARISQDLYDDPNHFYRYLCRSLTSRGDAAVIEKKHLDCARAWYCESLAIYDGVSKGEDRDPVYAIVRFLYSTLGVSQIPIERKIPNIYETLQDILNHHPQREKVFDLIAYLIHRSFFASKHILGYIYTDEALRDFAIEYLKNEGIAIPTTIKQDNFLQLWNELQKKTVSKMHTISSELKLLNNVEITTAGLENAIVRLKVIENQLIFNLDKERTMNLQKILEYSINLSKQIKFGEHERLSIQIDNMCKDLIKNIEDSPTKLSIEEINPIVETVRNKVQLHFDERIKNSMPRLTLELLEESYVPDDMQRITIQIEVTNEEGCSEAESLELIIPEEKGLYQVISGTKSDESLRADEPRNMEIILEVTHQAIESQTFSMQIYAQYRSRFSPREIKKTSVENCSIRLYPKEEFEPIENPYNQYAHGGVVEDPKMFYGREQLIQKIIKSIQESSTQSKGIIIFGQKRSGKSSILHHLKVRLEKEKDLLVVDIGNIGSILEESKNTTTFLHLILWTILLKFKYALRDRVDDGFTQLNITFPSDIEFYANPSPLLYFKAIFDEFMYQAKKSENWSNVRIVLLIDEFSYIYGEIMAGRIPETFMKNWKALLQDNYFSVVLAGQDVMQKFQDKYPNEFGTMHPETVSYLEDEDTINLIDEPIRIGGRQGKSRYREQAIKRILDLTYGNPFYTQIICYRLVEYMNDKHAILVTKAYVEHVKDGLIRGKRSLGLNDFDNLIDSGDTSKDAVSHEDILNVLRTIAINSRIGEGDCYYSNINCKTSSSIDIILADLENRKVIGRVRENSCKILVGLFKEWLIANM
ncbi:MAG: tetratricopeptide repeat protein [Bacteroidales bacterium]|nr:tetratricopeptide repeat protein [Bacteroidales bacterium]